MQTREEVMELVIYKLNSKCIPDLAERAQLTPSCLYSIRNRKTKWPRWNTFKRVLPLLGLTLIITEEGNFNENLSR